MTGWCCLAASLLWGSNRCRAEGVEPRPSMENAVAPFAATFCLDCHSGDEPEGGLALAAMLEAPSSAHRRDWQRVLAKLQTHEMPPEGMDQPDEDQRANVVEWLRVELETFDCSGPQNPGRVTVRRLNRVEYQNTVRDLLAVDFDAESFFPRDELGFGFDNNGDVLSMPPSLVEAYLQAAAEIAARAIVAEDVSDERLPASHRRLMEGSPSAEEWGRNRRWVEKSRPQVERLLLRAYRRPPTKDEVRRIIGLLAEAHDGGDTYAEAMRQVVEAVLVSPNFLFRGEADGEASREAGDGATAGEGEEDGSPAAYDLDDFAVATRLSYFLWSTMPDDELLRLAEAGELRERLDEQVDRMLKDPRADELVRNFGEQWLETRSLETLTRDEKLFPEFDAALRDAMREETFLFLRDIVRNDKPLSTLLTADYTFANKRLAEHYGLKGAADEGFVRVELPPERRAGVLAHASVLAVTSHGDRTSPVLRGKWVLNRLLADAPPPPPPGVTDLPDASGELTGATLRERLERHRADPSCAVCHQRMDPLGLSLENFDPLGRWRATEGEATIDASGQLPDGRTFEGPTGLRDVLAEDFPQIRRALAEKLLIYALGRGPEPYDECAVDSIDDAAAANGETFSSMLRAVVHSTPFLKQSAEE